MTKTHNITRYEYAGIDGCRSWCRLEIWQDARHPPVVLATERLDNDGTSITNRAEYLAARVCQEFGLEPRALIWLETYEREEDEIPVYDRSALTNRGEFDRVYFEIVRGNHLSEPSWEFFGLDAAEQLVGELL